MVSKEAGERGALAAFLGMERRSLYSIELGGVISRCVLIVFVIGY